jgi:cell division transport system ATP-binding protein
MGLDTVIEFQDVNIFQHDHLVLSNVNIKIDKGEFVYLIGKTGSGKSSFLKSLYADLPLKDGKAEIAGYDLRKIKNKEIPFLRRKLGIIFQDFQLLMDRSVEDNLKFIMKATGWKNQDEIYERINNVLDKVDLRTKSHKMPHQLSGGEQQRLAIARALINDPEIILADEPSGNLDPETSAGILNLLIDISKNGRSVILATHDYDLFEIYPSRTLKCDAGQIIDSNTL